MGADLLMDAGRPPGCDNIDAAMTAAKSKSHGVSHPADPSKGLFRAVLAGPGHTLAEAFANIEHDARVERIVRHPQLDLFGARVSLQPGEGEGYWELTRIRNEIYVITQNFSYRDPRLEIVPGDGLVQFNFRLSGDLTIAVKRSVPLRINRPSLLVWNQQRGSEVSEWTAPSARERAVSISLPPDFLVENFLPTHAAVPEQLQAFIAPGGREVNHCRLPLSAQMFELANGIVNNPHVGSLALIHTEAIVLELLCCAMESFASLPSSPNERYSQRELKCLQVAREFVIHQLAPAPTIRQVARAAGLNETTLKRGFKAIFGETLFEFSVRCRMQHALKLLRDQQLPVKRVAEVTGYSHHTSFATAFLRHFGSRPKDIRGARQRQRAQ
jgi:AraC-like DNA-binding protein